MFCPDPPISRSQPRSRRAFTLMEVIVGLAIFAGGILGVIGVFSTSAQTASRATALHGALNIAERQLELAALRTADDLQPTGSNEGRYDWSLSFSDRGNQLTAATIVVDYEELGEPRQLVLNKLFKPAARREGPAP